uniref:Uncharacterized protein n=1 Tax=Sphaerodactylus townsendi TaxID=933632 RepID=A0ACB8ELV4_9SAUR
MAPSSSLCIRAVLTSFRRISGFELTKQSPARSHSMSFGRADLGGDAAPFANSNREGYKEEHDLVVVDSTDEPHDGDEKQEEAHSKDPSNDVDAGDNAEAFPPGSHANQQEPD